MKVTHSIEAVTFTAELSKALTEAHTQYAERNPRSEQLHLDGQQNLPGGNTRTVLYSYPFPITFISGKDATLTSVDGHVYTDFLNEYSAGVYGHSNPQILKAIHEALANGWNFGGHSQYEKILAREVVQRFGPNGIEQVRFTNSGTEANMMALAAATQFTARTKILVFSEGYHGGTLVFSKASMQNLGTMTTNVPHDWVFAPYNNITKTELIVNGLPRQSLAAIMVEPVQGAGGCRPASREFLTFLYQTAKKQGALLIVDEVMTSRLGPHGYFSAATGLKADMVTLGKYVGGGMTFGAFGGRSEIMQLFDPTKRLLPHAGTYNNNVLSMAAGIAGLQIFNVSEVERLNAMGLTFRDKLQAILAEELMVKSHFYQPSNIIEIDSLDESVKMISTENGSEVPLPPIFITGYGSMLNVRFSGSQVDMWNGLFYHHMLQNDIYIATRGYMSLSLEINRSHVDGFLSAFRSFVQKHKRLLLL